MRNLSSVYRSMHEKKLDPVGKEDADVDNDGDSDSSDEYLKKRRKAISKTMAKEATEIVRKADLKPEKYTDPNTGKIKTRNRRSEIRVQTEEVDTGLEEGLGGGNCGPNCNCNGCSSINENVKIPAGATAEQKKHINAFLKSAKGSSPAMIKTSIDAIMKNVNEASCDDKKVTKGKKDEIDMKPKMKDERLVQERSLTDAEKEKKEEIVKSMKKKYESFQDRYGDRAKTVMYATATKLAKREGFEYDFIEEDFIVEAMKPYVSSAGGKHSVLNSSGKSVAEYKNIKQANAHLEKHYDKLSKSHK